MFPKVYFLVPEWFFNLALLVSFEVMTSSSQSGILAHVTELFSLCILTVAYQFQPAPLWGLLNFFCRFDPDIFYSCTVCLLNISDSFILHVNVWTDEPSLYSRMSKTCWGSQLSSWYIDWCPLIFCKCRIEEAVCLRYCPKKHPRVCAHLCKNAHKATAFSFGFSVIVAKVPSLSVCYNLEKFWKWRILALLTKGDCTS